MRAWLRAHPLWVIVVAQLCGTSLWFSINGVWSSLALELGLAEASLGRLTLGVQAGFIVGTLTLAVLNAVGFALTIPAIWITSSLWSLQGPWVVLWLLPGPVLGLIALRVRLVD